MGVLTALPIVSAGNFCCCLWVISGGVVAAYMLQQATPAPLRLEDGAIVGLLAGVIGAVVYLLLSIPVTLLVAPMQRLLLTRLRDQMPPDLQRIFGGYTGAGLGLLVGFVAGFIFWLFIGAVFSTLGGMLGAAIFRKKEPPPVAPGSGNYTIDPSTGL
jgi:hypothetical protein